MSITVSVRETFTEEAAVHAQMPLVPVAAVWGRYSLSPKSRYNLAELIRSPVSPAVSPLAKNAGTEPLSFVNERTESVSERPIPAHSSLPVLSPHF